MYYSFSTAILLFLLFLIRLIKIDKTSKHIFFYLLYKYNGKGKKLGMYTFYFNLITNYLWIYTFCSNYVPCFLPISINSPLKFYRSFLSIIRLLTMKEAQCVGQDWRNNSQAIVIRLMVPHKVSIRTEVQLIHRTQGKG